MHKPWKYIASQLDVVPKTVYLGLLALFCVGAIVLLVVNRKKAGRHIAWLLFFEFVFLVLGMTVFYRHTDSKAVVYLPFWSYVSVWRYRNMAVLYEIILNVLLFVPIGFLWGTQRFKHTTKQQWFVAFLLGLGLSLGIESLQLLFKKGSFEIDDIIHNTLGCLMGFGLWRVCATLMVAI